MLRVSRPTTGHSNVAVALLDAARCAKNRCSSRSNATRSVSFRSNLYCGSRTRASCSKSLAILITRCKSFFAAGKICLCCASGKTFMYSIISTKPLIDVSGDLISCEACANRRCRAALLSSRFSMSRWRRLDIRLKLFAKNAISSSPRSSSRMLKSPSAILLTPIFKRSRRRLR